MKTILNPITMFVLCTCTTALVIIGTCKLAATPIIWEGVIVSSIIPAALAAVILYINDKSYTKTILNK